MNSGGRYDPASNTWSSTTTVGAPSGRQLHSAVWTGSRMIVWGGTDGSITNTGGEYDPRQRHVGVDVDIGSTR